MIEVIPLNIGLVAYLAHPVAGDVPGNLARAKRWIKWLEGVHLPNVAVIAPWITECEIWNDNDPQLRANGVARDLEVLIRCDMIIMVGGRVSPGMAAEAQNAEFAGLMVIDLTHLGEEPPE